MLNPYNISNSDKIIMCRRGCGTRIVFNDKMLSKNSKKIPLNFSDNLPHECPLRNQDEWKPNLQRFSSAHSKAVNPKDATSVRDSEIKHYTQLDLLVKKVENSNKQYEMLLIEYNYIKKQLQEFTQILRGSIGKSP